jgi:hypothetical protein
MSDEVEALKFKHKDVLIMKQKRLTQKQVFNDLKDRLQATLGKNAENKFAIASICTEAKQKLDKANYDIWLKMVAKMCEGTASKYRSIDACEFLHAPGVVEQLPPDYTIWYPLTQLKTKALFDKGVKFVSQNAPTVAALEAFVRELLGKQPKEKLHRTGKLVTNNQKIVAEVKRQTAKAKQEVEKVKEQVHEAKAEVKSLQAKLVTTAYIPSKEEIAEMDFEDDGNEILVENFKKAYLASQLKKKIAALLHAEGYSNIQVIVRQRQAFAGKLKVAA